MGLKCSLFGHTFDERDTVRERESKGSEVVTVVKDVERCTECDATRVVSTNKEVVSVAGATADGGVSSGPDLRTPGDGGDAFETPAQLESATGPAGSEAPTGTADESGGVGGFVDRTDASAETDDPAPDALPDDEGVELVTDEPDAAASADVAEEPSASTDEPAPAPADTEADTGEPESAPNPETEDAEILTDEPDPDRAPGQWPGDEADEAWEPRPLTEDDATAGDGADADTPDVDAADADGEGETPDTEAEPAPEIEPAATATFTVPEGHYRCPECGHTIPAESSFRRGDACPECVHGYLEAGE